MYTKHAFLIVFVVAIWSTAALSVEPGLKLGQVRESTLRAGQAQCFVVSLSDSDFAQIGVNPSHPASLCDDAPHKVGCQTYTDCKHFYHYTHST